MSIAIQVENVSKMYQLGSIGTGTLSRDIERWVARMRGKEDPFMFIGETNDRSTPGVSNVVWSLKDINFEINQGDAIGIIGRNGAGKSTLLKVLSRITSPTTGTIKLKGRIASLLEVGTGFHPELSGRENIYLNGAILGMRKREIDRKFDEILAFSGVERYVDTAVKRYSSGMYVRLAFAVAAHLESEILIVDEVLAVGDLEFQKKCLGKMGEVSKGEGRTVLFVSHNLGSIAQLCNKSMVLKYGHLLEFGKTHSIIKRYLDEATSTAVLYEGPQSSDKKVWFKKICPVDKHGQVKDQFLHDDAIHFNFDLGYNILQDEHDYSIFFTVIDTAKSKIFSTESQVVTSESIQLTIEPNFLVRGNYSIHAFIHKPNTEEIDVVDDVCNFSVIDNGSEFLIHGDYDYGKVFGRCSWKQVNTLQASISQR
ncbi:MAG: ABC transporter ATP-binding protein [Chitinophagaceae bacterium]